jgi:hypothetical protein
MFGQLRWSDRPGCVQMVQDTGLVFRYDISALICARMPAVTCEKDGRVGIEKTLRW